MSTSTAENQIQFELELGVHSLSYLSDHRVNGAIVLPAATYLEMVLVTAADALGSASYTITDVTFHQALVIPEAVPCTLRFVLNPTAPHTASFMISSVPGGAEQTPSAEIKHVTGTIEHGPEAAMPARRVDQAGLRSRCSQAFAAAAHYQAMQARGISYGPAFQAINQIWRGQGEALSLLRLAPALEPEIEIYQMHPTLLDAGFQSIAVARLQDQDLSRENDTFLPAGLHALRVFDRFDTQIWCHAVITSGMDPDAAMFEADVTFFDETGQIVAEVLGLRLEQLQRGTTRTAAPASPPQIQPHVAAPAATEPSAQPVDGALGNQHALAAQRLAKIWAEVLQFQTVDIHDSFLDLGGDSLMASQIAAQANRYGLEITPQQIIEHRTIARLIDVVTATQEIYNA